MQIPPARLPVAIPCCTAAIAASPAISIRALDTAVARVKRESVHGRVNRFCRAHNES